MIKAHVMLWLSFANGPHDLPHHLEPELPKHRHRFLIASRQVHCQWRVLHIPLHIIEPSSFVGIRLFLPADTGALRRHSIQPATVSRPSETGHQDVKLPTPRLPAQVKEHICSRPTLGATERNVKENNKTTPCRRCAINQPPNSQPESQQQSNPTPKK